MIYAAFFLGVAVGVLFSFMLAEFLARREHREWMKLCDRYEKCIEQLKSKQLSNNR